MTFDQATKFTQIDWEQPEHSEKRNNWAAGRSSIKNVSSKDMSELEACVRDFEDGIKKGKQIGPRVKAFFSLIEKEGRKSPLVWEYYTKYFKIGEDYGKI